MPWNEMLVLDERNSSPITSRTTSLFRTVSATASSEPQATNGCDGMSRKEEPASWRNRVPRSVVRTLFLPTS